MPICIHGWLVCAWERANARASRYLDASSRCLDTSNGDASIPWVAWATVRHQIWHRLMPPAPAHIITSSRASPPLPASRSHAISRPPSRHLTYQWYGAEHSSWRDGLRAYVCAPCEPQSICMRALRVACIRSCSALEGSSFLRSHSRAIAFAAPLAVSPSESRGRLREGGGGRGGLLEAQLARQHAVQRLFID